MQITAHACPAPDAVTPRKEKEMVSPTLFLEEIPAVQQVGSPGQSSNVGATNIRATTSANTAGTCFPRTRGVTRRVQSRATNLTRHGLKPFVSQPVLLATLPRWRPE